MNEPEKVCLTYDRTQKAVVEVGDLRVYLLRKLNFAEYCALKVLGWDSWNIAEIPVPDIQRTGEDDGH